DRLREHSETEPLHNGNGRQPALVKQELKDRFGQNDLQDGYGHQRQQQHSAYLNELLSLQGSIMVPFGECREKDVLQVDRQNKGRLRRKRETPVIKTGHGRVLLQANDETGAIGLQRGE